MTAWTFQRPEKPGYYWHRLDADLSPTVRKVFWVCGANQFAENGVVPLDKICGEWWPDRIPTPDEKDQEAT